MMISISDAKKTFHGRTVVDGISLEVEKGELVALIGHSGCGKSTLLRCVNGLETLDDGAIRVLGTEIRNPAQSGHKVFEKNSRTIRHEVGMVFQSFNLFPHQTILQNMMTAQTVVLKRKKEEAREVGLKLLRKVGLEDKADHYPAELSGGQQQRAAIARALAVSPKVLLYDEPTSALDPSLVNEVLKVMKDLNQEGMTQLVVTHEMRFAREVADRIVFIKDGKIVESGPPEQIFGAPRDERTREFLRHFQP